MKTIRLYYIMAVTTVGFLCLSAGMIGCKQEKETVARTGTEQQVDDALTEQVKTAFKNSLAFKFPDVQVVVFKGKVQLNGFVSSEDQKSSAESIAKGIPGVVEVENNISLKN